MKIHSKWIGVSVGVLFTGLATANQTQTRFGSTVQLAIQEANVQRMNTMQDVVIREFEQGLARVPVFKEANISVQRSGNEVVFSMMTDEDLTAAMRPVVVALVQKLNLRKWRARGRINSFRASLTQPPQADFFLTVHDPQKRTLFIDAKQAPLIDLLQVIRQQIPTFSYIIPQECAQRRVYWTFGNPKKELHPDNLELHAAMTGIAEMLQIKVEDMGGAFVFAGDCQAAPIARAREAELAWPEELIPMPMRWPSAPRVAPSVEALPPDAVAVSSPPPLLPSRIPAQVDFPVTPIGYVH